MKYSILVILAILIAVIMMTRLITGNNTKKYLSKFTEVAELGSYAEAAPRISENPTKAEHAVLLLHGYSDSPYSFEGLIRELERAKIPYYAPLLTGFGLNSLDLLRRIRAEDWFRDAIQAYELMAAQAEKISILGHSNGGALATFVAQHRPVHHLILSGPNLMVAPSDKIYKQILNTPVLSSIFQTLVPIFTKPKRGDRVTNVDTLDPEAALQAFHYPSLPIRSLKALWDVQDRVDIGSINCHSLTFLYGEQDNSVDMPAIQQILDTKQISYRSISYANSAHNILEDYERERAVKRIISILQG